MRLPVVSISAERAAWARLGGLGLPSPRELSAVLHDLVRPWKHSPRDRKELAPGLSYRVGEAEHSMNFWLNGQASVPQRVLKAVDIVLAEDLARAAQDRHQLPRHQDAEREPGPQFA